MALELLPKPLRLIAGVLPFKYIHHYPLTVLLVVANGFWTYSLRKYSSASRWPLDKVL